MFQRYSTADAVGHGPERSDQLGLRSVPPPGRKPHNRIGNETGDELRRLGPEVPRRAFSERER
jgi:hypothetical protein